MATHGNLGCLQELPPKQVEIFAKSFEFLPNFLTSSLKQLCTENGFPNMRWMARVNEVIEVNKVNEMNEVNEVNEVIEVIEVNKVLQLNEI